MRWLRIVLAVVALVALALALQQAVQDAGEVTLPGPVRLAITGCLLSLSLLMAASAWGMLLPGVTLRRVLPGFTLAQLAKYVPGSVWQAVGQVADAQRLGVATGTASFAYVVQLALQVVAAAAASFAAGALPGLPWWLRLPALMGPAALVMVNRRWLASALAMVARRSSRLHEAQIELPTQRELVGATWRSGVTIVGLGAGYAVLLPSSDGLPTAVGTAGVFMLAWLIGFLVVPLPAGVGIREAVLVAGLAAVHPVADVLAAAVVFRLVLVVVEGLLAALGQFGRLPSRAAVPPGSGESVRPERDGRN